jgi:DtxR family Mn-dependent transcriptional regulator
MPSQSVEDYLKIIYRLEASGGSSTGKIAEQLNVAPASVTSMTKRLVKMGLAEHASHKDVHLTTAGKQKALQIIRHHRLLETFLIQIMGYTWDDVHEEAEQLEHHISPMFEEKMAAMLGEPLYDPHGDPIPLRDGTMPPVFTLPLTDAPENAEVVIRRVSNDNPEMLRHFFQRGLIPGRKIRIVSKDPFNGPITLIVDGQTQIIGFELAGKLFIEL